MKAKITALLLLIFSLLSQAQISLKDLESAMRDMERLIKDQVGNIVKLMCIGDVATLAKDKKLFNTSLCAYVISKNGFRHVTVLELELLVRPLSNNSLDTMQLTSSMLRYLSRIHKKTPCFCKIKKCSSLISDPAFF